MDKITLGNTYEAVVDFTPLSDVTALVDANYRLSVPAALKIGAVRGDGVSMGAPSITPEKNPFYAASSGTDVSLGNVTAGDTSITVSMYISQAVVDAINSASEDVYLYLADGSGNYFKVPVKDAGYDATSGTATINFAAPVPVDGSVHTCGGYNPVYRAEFSPLNTGNYLLTVVYGSQVVGRRAVVVEPAQGASESPVLV